MDSRDLCGCILRFYSYADATKMIHYTTNSNHQHELCDELRSVILGFVDDFAEQMFGIVGKPSMQDFSEDIPLERIDYIEDICERCGDLAEVIKSHIEDDRRFDCICSLIDDFVGKVRQKQFLATFDHNANY